MGKRLFYAQRTLVDLFSVTNKLQMQGDKYLQDITLRQMLAIPALFHAPNGKATINDVARQLGTSKQSARQIVDAMARKKYVSVSPSEQDRRAVDIVITPEGRKAFGISSERNDRFLADIFGDFTNEEIGALHALLEKLFCFDGVKQDDPMGHVEYNSDDAEEILRHHPNFEKR